jgi:hypothetical protein
VTGRTYGGPADGKVSSTQQRRFGRRAAMFTFVDSFVYVETATLIADPYGEAGIGVTNDHHPYEELGVGVTNDHQPYEEEGIGVANDHHPYEELGVGVTNDHLTFEDGLFA